MNVAISRSAEALAATLALLTLAGGLLLRAVGDGGAPALAGAGAGLLVAWIGLELYARGVGAWAARERPGAVGLCLVVGSPAVLGHAAFGRSDGPLAPEGGALAALAIPVVLIMLAWAFAAR